MLRPIRLARIGAEAEIVRLRRQTQRTVVRVVLGLIALVFLTAAVVTAHVAFWFWLRVALGWAPAAAAAILTGGDLLLAIILGLLAAKSGPSRLEREALEVRRRAWDQAGNTMAVSALLVPVLRVAVDLLRRVRK
jgi:hypothetical protein